MKDLITALKSGNLYDFIANNGWRFDKSELVELIKELDYALYEVLGEETLKKVEKRCAENLEENDYE